MYNCTFIGHSSCDIEIRNILFETIEKLIINKKVFTFYVGTHGKFDRYVYDVLCELRKFYKIEIYIVLSHINSIPDYCKNAKTIFPEVLEKTPFRYAITKRNLYMIENSQYMICYLENTFTNTYEFVKKAYRKKLTIINIGHINSVFK